MTATTVISEAGYDISKWQTENHFVSWLRRCPDNRISGGKVIGKGRLPTNNPVTIALKLAASTLRKSKTYLGAQFRRLRTRLRAPMAIKAMAAKLARLVYRMLRYGMKYVDQGAAFYEAQHRQLQIKQLKWKARQVGIQSHPTSGGLKREFLRSRCDQNSKCRIWCRLPKIRNYSYLFCCTRSCTKDLILG